MACALSLCRTMAKDRNNVPGVRGHISISVQGMKPLVISWGGAAGACRAIYLQGGEHRRGVAAEAREIASQRRHLRALRCGRPLPMPHVSMLTFDEYLF